MPALTFGDIFAARDLQPFAVPCPEWGGDVYLLPMMGNDLDAWDQKTAECKYPRDDKGNLIEGDWKGLRAYAVAHQMCDETGRRFAATDADVLALGQKCGKALGRCFEALQRASGLLPDDVEDAEKNLPPGQTGSSG